MVGGSLVRLALYLFGFILGVTLGSWLAFTLFLNDSTTIVFRQFNEVGNIRRKLIEFTQIVSVEDNKSNSIDVLRVHIKQDEPAKILCVVAYISNDVKRLHAINDTYAYRCSKTVYYSPSHRARGFDVTYIDSDEVSYTGGYGSWNFFRSVLKRIMVDHSKDNYDWIIYLDDKTYLIYDNLKYFLSKYDSRNPLFIGNLQKTLFTEYFIKEAGFVLSNKTFALLNKFMVSTCSGWWYSSATEYALTKCLRSIGVRTMDGADAKKGGHRFLPKGPKELFTRGDSWALKWQDPSKCCSDSAISFGQLAPREFYLLEYMLYKLEPYGAVHVE